MSEWGFAILGLLLGAGATGAILALRQAGQRHREIERSEEERGQRASELSAMTEQLRTAFSALSREALSANADDFLKLARTQLDQQSLMGTAQLEEKKRLIDSRLEEMGARLTSLNQLIQGIEQERNKAFGSLTGQLEKHAQVTGRLHETTHQLREALAHPQRRGQWGERMAEDLLRLAGLIEGVNYAKQQRVGGGDKPDFTFFLPENRRVHMDVKFPLANYLRAVEADTDPARKQAVDQFLKDVRSRIREVATREYIDPAAGTVDYALVFIPNEEVYSFIHQHDPALMDDALRTRVVPCSPLSLYAVISVIRQASENFRFEQSSRRILDLLGEFHKQWKLYVEVMERLGKRLGETVKAYEDLSGARSRQLDRHLERIEDARGDRSDLIVSSSEQIRVAEEESRTSARPMGF